MDAEDRLSEFLSLEKKWLDLRNATPSGDSEEIDSLADAMDTLWLEMTADEKLQLNSRW